MYKIFTIELYKIFKRPRTYISFGALTVFILLLQFGLKQDGKSFIDFFLGDLSNSFQFDGNLLNGYSVCFFILLSLLVHIPLLVVIISADAISGEANLGTLRLLCSSSVSRTNIVLGKFAAICVYIILLLLWFALLALAVSIAVFGTGDILHMKSDYIVLINNNDILWRYFLAFLFAAVALITIASLSIFISVFSENTIVPIAITMCVIIVSLVINTMNIPTFANIKPFLFTSYLSNWRGFFDVLVNDDNEAIKGSLANKIKIIQSIFILILHIFGFIYLSIYFLKKKDILS